MTHEPVSVGEVLERAAEHIERAGLWKHGQSVDFEGLDAAMIPRCAQLAICDQRPGPIYEACDAFAKFLGMPSGNSLQKIWRWNDAPERTQAEVVEALRQAARLSKEDQQ